LGSFIGKAATDHRCEPTAVVIKTGGGEGRRGVDGSEPALMSGAIEGLTDTVCARMMESGCRGSDRRGG